MAVGGWHPFVIRGAFSPDSGGQVGIGIVGVAWGSCAMSRVPWGPVVGWAPPLVLSAVFIGIRHNPPILENARGH